jgi:hypothetical protein
MQNLSHSLVYTTQIWLLPGCIGFWITKIFVMHNVESEIMASEGAMGQEFSSSKKQ